MKKIILIKCLGLSFLLLNLASVEAQESTKKKNAIYAGISLIDPIGAGSISYERFLVEKLSIGVSLNETVKDREVTDNEGSGCSFQFASCTYNNQSRKTGGLVFLRFFPMNGSFFLNVAAGKQPHLKQEVHLGQDINVNAAFPTPASAFSAIDIIYRRTNVSYGIFSLGWRWLFGESLFLQAEGGVLK
ncbi:hypothetical protein [Leptospira inadai]|uniref:Outer membrane protein beta-barrel domain protein n=1 Tax=Leptospira inadai serovar Lyme TaxID=293084 RepID=A0ABX4YJJ0_9LEPT|nr:hypothetical protein [Leptospira inadai]PNV75442.1 hypothetical protein BES34_009365 [Leptospira inadai serovar Lyme]